MYLLKNVQKLVKKNSEGAIKNYFVQWLSGPNILKQNFNVIWTHSSYCTIYKLILYIKKKLKCGNIQYVTIMAFFSFACKFYFQYCYHFKPVPKNHYWSSKQYSSTVQMKALFVFDFNKWQQ